MSHLIDDFNLEDELRQHNAAYRDIEIANDELAEENEQLKAKLNKALAELEEE